MLEDGKRQQCRDQRAGGDLERGRAGGRDLHRQHPVNIFMLPILARLDRTRINLHIYHTGTMHDAFTLRSQGYADRWMEAAALTDTAFEWAQVKLVPGLSGSDAQGVAEVMRGEEAQIVGVPTLMESGGIACLPGTHSKWARVEGGRIVSFTTHMTGEVFAALRGHTILGRTMRDGPSAGAPFEAGVRRAAEPGGLLHHIFGVRAQTLTGALAETDAAAYLSGILIGHEVSAALAGAAGAVVHVIGNPDLAALYATAIAACGGYAERHDGEAAALGLFRIGEHAAWR